MNTPNPRVPSEYFPEVVQVIPTDDFKIYAYFSDGTIHLMDVRPLVESNPALQPLSDLAFFKERATVLNRTAAWDVTGTYDPWQCIDIDPETIYESPRVSDPLESDVKCELAR